MLSDISISFARHRVDLHKIWSRYTLHVRQYRWPTFRQLNGNLSGLSIRSRALVERIAEDFTLHARSEQQPEPISLPPPPSLTNERHASLGHVAKEEYDGESLDWALNEDEDDGRWWHLIRSISCCFFSFLYRVTRETGQRFHRIERKRLVVCWAYLNANLLEGAQSDYAKNIHCCW